MLNLTQLQEDVIIASGERLAEVIDSLPNVHREPSAEEQQKMIEAVLPFFEQVQQDPGYIYRHIEQLHELNVGSKALQTDE